MTMNFGLDREIDEVPKDLDKIRLIQGTGSGYPGRRNDQNYDPALQIGSALQQSDFLQDYRGWEPTNAVDADSRLYNTSDQQPAMPLEITGAAKLAAHRKFAMEEFDTDHIDSRQPESLANVINQPFITGLVEKDILIDKLFKDLDVMTDPGTMNSQGESTIGADAAGKEAAYRQLAKKLSFQRYLK
jgi:hypothetical protein